MKLWVMVGLTVATVSAGGGASLAPAQSVEKWTATPVRRVGSIDDPDLSFSRILDLTVDHLGRIYIAQWQQPSITVLHPDGRFLRRFGRSGQGPAEFIAPVRFGWRGDTLWIYDVMQERISFWNSAFQLLRTLPIKYPTLSDLHAGFSTVAVTPDDAVLAEARASVTFVKAGINDQVPLIRFFGASHIDTLAWLSVLNAHAETKLPDGRRVVTFQPFSDASLYALERKATKLVVVDRRVTRQSIYSLLAVKPNGDTIFSRQLKYAPLPIEKRHADSVITDRAKSLIENRYASGRVARSVVEQSLYLPRAYPPVTAVVVARNGMIWLRGPDLRRNNANWHILSNDGRIRAEIELPRYIHPLEITDRYVYAVTRDDLEVPYILVYRLGK